MWLDEQCRYYADETAKSGKGSFDVEAILSVNQQQVFSRSDFPALAITVITIAPGPDSPRRAS
jgi:hypothetical protein